LDELAYAGYRGTHPHNIPVRRYRRPEALPALRRIIANKSIQKHNPGILAAAREVVTMIEDESSCAIR
jgi:hypothetical protein